MILRFHIRIAPAMTAKTAALSVTEYSIINVLTHYYRSHVIKHAVLTWS